MKFLPFLLLFIQLSCEKEINPSLKFFLEPQESIGIILEESSGSTDLFEGVTIDSYVIKLKNRPSRNYTIKVHFDTNQLILNDSLFSPLIISFSSENWDIPQNISVKAVFDNKTEGIHQSTIRHTQNYAPTSIYDLGSIKANITDNLGSRLTSSFQSGTATLTSMATSISLTTTVNIAKAYVYCNFQLVGSGADRAATCQLNSTGTVVEIITGSAGTNTVVNWYVVEFSLGALVQRSVSNFNTSELTKSITLTNSVDPDRTFIIAYSRTSDTSNTQDERRTTLSTLTNATTLTLSRQESGTTVDVEWQVIQLDGARVQSGQSVISNSNTSTQSTIGTINLNNSFILMSTTGSPNIDGIETDLYVQGNFIDSRTINFRRTGNTNSVAISWFAIEMIDGTSVQTGSVTVPATLANGQTSLNAIDTGKTMIVSSYRVETGNTTQATQDSGTFSSLFLNSTTIRFERFVAENNICEITWYAVSYQ